MSRIHEALKRAAQERSTQLAAGIEAQVAEVASESRRPETVASVPGPATPSRVAAAAASKVVVGSGYEELIVRCCHPEWRLCLLKRVVLNSDIGQAAAQRFLAPRTAD